jgi:predicted nucleic acid-binding protein
MTLVVDASVVLAWSFESESSDAATAAIERLLREEGIAPAHWPLEVANAIRYAERRGRIGSAEIGRLAAILRQLPVDLIPVDVPDAIALVDVARTLDVSVYDAAYVGLAGSRGLPLATVDRRLADAARAAGVEVLAA